MLSSLISFSLKSSPILQRGAPEVMTIMLCASSPATGYRICTRLLRPEFKSIAYHTRWEMMEATGTGTAWYQISREIDGNQCSPLFTYQVHFRCRCKIKAATFTHLCIFFDPKTNNWMEWDDRLGWLPIASHLDLMDLVYFCWSSCK